jgi:hypothetical protein
MKSTHMRVLAEWFSYSRRHIAICQKNYSILAPSRQGAVAMKHRLPPAAARGLSRSLDSWAVLAAALFILAIVFGSLPRLPW